MNIDTRKAIMDLPFYLWHLVKDRVQVFKRLPQIGSRSSKAVFNPAVLRREYGLLPK
jgi:hypothetical protein